MEPGEGLERRRPQHRLDVLGLRGGLHHALGHLLHRVGVLGPGPGPAHEVANHLDGQVGPLEGRARLGAAHPDSAAASGMRRRSASCHRSCVQASRAAAVCSGTPGSAARAFSEERASDTGSSLEFGVCRAASTSPTAIVVAGALLLLFGLVRLLRQGRRGARGFVSDVDQATHATLHTASLASRHLQDGLTTEGTAKAAKHLRALLGSAALAVCDHRSVLAWDGAAEHHRQHAREDAAEVLATGRTIVLGHDAVGCGDPDCPVRTAVIAPVVTEERVVAAVAAYGPQASAGLARATEEVARWVSTQAELAELGRERTRTMEAELRALRAQISPHFIYNSLAAIASFVRTDPERARELLLEFADFTRYALRRGGRSRRSPRSCATSSATSSLEQARFGDRLQISLLIAPEVLPVTVPYLAIQPLVENAVRHGLAARRAGHVTILATDMGAEAEICVEDDGVGSDPEAIRRVLDGRVGADSVGLGNVDARLRQVYGDEYGLVVETAPGRRNTGDLPRAQVRARSPRLAVGSPPCERWPGLPRERMSPDGEGAGRPVCAPWSSTTSCRPWPSSATCSPGQPRRRGRTAGLGHRGAQGARRTASRRRLLRHLDARSRRAGPGPGHLPVRPAPQVVFVTAYDEHAVDAFAVEATDYVMKPIRPERLARRCAGSSQRIARGCRPVCPAPRPPEDETIPVELGGVTRFINRSQIRYAQAHGDYARLHTAAGSHLVRMSADDARGALGRCRIRAHPPQYPRRAAPRHGGAKDPGRCSVVLGGRRSCR